MTSFLSRVQKSKSGKIWLLRTRDKLNRSCYFYVQVDAIKKSILEKQVGVSGLTITDFGAILESGFGENPPPNIIAKMKAEYGFEG